MTRDELIREAFFEHNRRIGDPKGWAVFTFGRGSFTERVFPFVKKYEAQTGTLPSIDAVIDFFSSSVRPRQPGKAR